jgi:hypothetical protein
LGAMGITSWGVTKLRVGSESSAGVAAAGPGSRLVTRDRRREARAGRIDTDSGTPRRTARRRSASTPHRTARRRSASTPHRAARRRSAGTRFIC